MSFLSCSAHCCVLVRCCLARRDVIVVVVSSFPPCLARRDVMIDPFLHVHSNVSCFELHLVRCQWYVAISACDRMCTDS